MSESLPGPLLPGLHCSPSSLQPPPAARCVDHRAAVNPAWAVPARTRQPGGVRRAQPEQCGGPESAFGARHGWRLSMGAAWTPQEAGVHQICYLLAEVQKPGTNQGQVRALGRATGVKECLRVTGRLSTHPWGSQHPGFKAGCCLLGPVAMRPWC